MADSIGAGASAGTVTVTVSGQGGTGVHKNPDPVPQVPPVPNETVGRTWPDIVLGAVKILGISLVPLGCVASALYFAKISREDLEKERSSFAIKKLNDESSLRESRLQLEKEVREERIRNQQELNKLQESLNQAHARRASELTESYKATQDLISAQISNLKTVNGMTSELQRLAQASQEDLEKAKITLREAEVEKSRINNYKAEIKKLSDEFEVIKGKKEALEKDAKEAQGKADNIDKNVVALQKKESALLRLLEKLQVQADNLSAELKGELANSLEEFKSAKLADSKVAEFFQNPTGQLGDSLQRELPSKRVAGIEESLKLAKYAVKLESGTDAEQLQGGEELFVAAAQAKSDSLEHVVCIWVGKSTRIVTKFQYYKSLFVLRTSDRLNLSKRVAYLLGDAEKIGDDPLELIVKVEDTWTPANLLSQSPFSKYKVSRVLSNNELTLKTRNMSIKEFEESYPKFSRELASSPKVELGYLLEGFSRMSSDKYLYRDERFRCIDSIIRSFVSSLDEDSTILKFVNGDRTAYTLIGKFAAYALLADREPEYKFDNIGEKIDERRYRIKVNLRNITLVTKVVGENDNVVESFLRLEEDDVDLK